MENYAAIYVQSNSHTTIVPATVCRFPGCIMPAVASLGQGSVRLNAPLLVDLIPALIHTARPDGYLDYCNKPWLEYLGVALDKVTGWNWTAFVHPEDLVGTVDKWRSCLATGEAFEYETRVRRADGEYRWMFHRNVPLRDENGNIVKWYGSSLDIDERKTAEEQLRRNAREPQRSEFYLAEGQRLAHMGSWAFDPDGFNYWSPELFRMHGLDPAGKPPSVEEYLDRVHPQDRESMADLIKGILANDSPFDATKRIVRPNGEVRYIRCVGAPAAENQSLKKYVGSAIDVTGHELLTQELRRREAYLTGAQRLSHTGSFGWRPDTGEIAWSDETYRIFEYDGSAKPTIDSLEQRVHPEDRAGFKEVMTRALAGATDFEHAYRLLLPDGRIKHVHALAHVLQDASGNREFVGAVSDITERRVAEIKVTERTSELRRRERELRDVLDSIPAIVWSALPDGSNSYVNSRFVEYCGMPPERLSGSGWHAVTHPDDLEQHNAKWLASVASGEPSEDELRFRRADREYRWHLVRRVPLRDEAGNIVKWYGIVTDIEDRKRTELALQLTSRDLQESKSKLEEAQRIAHVGYWEWDVRTGRVNWSDETYRIYGLRPQELPMDLATLQKKIHPEDWGGVVQALEEALSGGARYNAECRVFRPTGEVRIIHSQGDVKRDTAGRPTLMFGTVQDITEHKQAEGKIREQEAELRQIVDLAPQLVAVFGPAHERLYANRILLDYLGITLEEWRQRFNSPVPTYSSEFLHPDDMERVAEHSDRAVSRGAAFELEMRLRKSDGSYRWFLARYNPLQDEEGQITRWYVTGTDIEDRKQAEATLHRENVALREEVDKASMFEEIVGASPALKSVLSRISKVAPSDSTVLITGETGTGKELVARAIHRRSDRGSRAFVSVNCAAVPRDLIASELFGHEKGSFTGASQQRLGRFELANKGTIFLDEVGELPIETQIALLRVLQEHEFERVGGSRRIRADVRVIAATNRDLQAAISAGSFRSDLFYRLNVFPIEIPSLQERREDIPLLVEYFIDRYARKAGKNIKRVSKKTLELLQSYPWPGNIRELQNVIERSVILCETEIFSIDESWLPQPEVELPQRLLVQEKDMIEAALKETRGRVFGPTGAAAKLGIPRSTLESKIRSLKIDKNRFRTKPGTEDFLV
jgi:PAS domain S-box-containing protein